MIDEFVGLARKALKICLDLDLCKYNFDIQLRCRGVTLFTLEKEVRVGMRVIFT